MTRGQRTHRYDLGVLQTRLLHRGSVDVVDYRCGEEVVEPFAEVHDVYSLSYVRRGSFACTTRGVTNDLVAGAVMIGHPGEEYLCTHDHHAGGDECLSLRFSPEAAERIGAAKWNITHLPPVDLLVVLGELAQAAADGQTTIAVDEVAEMFAAQFQALLRGTSNEARAPRESERRKMLDLAHWLELRSSDEIDLASAAHEAAMSPYHFLRTFAAVLGVTPHQYVLRARLRRAARSLAVEERSITEVAGDVGFNDLSNFVRTFRRAAGMSPRQFRQMSRGRSGWRVDS